MEVMYSVCCGVDVHKKILVCCLMRGRKKEIREFGASTRELIELSSWLKENKCEMVAMESTASYWKPLYNILEAQDVKAMVVNAQHIKALPGRKTDTLDAEWIAELLRHGLLRASYIPPKPQRELRELLTYRKSLTVDAASEQNRIQKMLEGGNIKISGTISSIIGKSGQHLLSCLINGEAITADDIRGMINDGLISSRLKAEPEELADDLNGVLTPVQRKMISICLEHIAYLNKRIDEIDTIVLEIGDLSLVVPQYVEDIYGLIVQDTRFARTKLKIEVVEGQGVCRDCKRAFPIVKNEGYCPRCGKRNAEVISGRDFIVKELIVP